MHQQIRLRPVKSPPDIEAVLEVLARHDINLVAAGGSDLELGGEFAFAVEPPGAAAERVQRRADRGSTDDHAGRAAEEAYVQDVLRILEKAGYEPRAVEATTYYLENRPGALHQVIAEVARENLVAGRVIRDLLVGVADPDGLVPVQVISQEVKTAANP